ncbi:MAG: imidazole glycerol phosphate synthase subunit HisF [Methylacidiphilales bacterium]|nr:imidazole glycerol phosphate synthase subunit HisF [Candidatus Methylacidiphilales bacterium]MDW8349722.1 imidazole glycerol phosphate synthase subunit HisF [Verrucomicrobiae bacterium]
MFTHRIIPCLDVHDGRVTRGQQFGRAEEGGLRNVGDPVELAVRYNEDGADELVFYDITASAQGRKYMLEVIERTAEKCFMPLTVGGGIRTVEDMRQLLRAGADKVSINSSAVLNPRLINEGAEIFGSQCIVLSVDVKKNARGIYTVYVQGGRKETGLEALAWIEEGVKRGAGEIVLNSIERDGMKTGYDIELTREVSTRVSVPVVASGGAGKMEDFLAVLTEGKADAALAAGVFHSGEIRIPELKAFLRRQGVNVRMP